MSPRRTPPPDTAEPTRIGLADLRAGPIERTLRIETPGESLGELPLPFDRLDIEVEIRRADGSGVRARGTLGARAIVECRRCLEPTQVAVRAQWDALYRPSDRTARAERADEGVWALDAGSRELDLAGPIREELWVNAPAYVECSRDCPGLCPACGVRLAEQACSCPAPPADARWAALEGFGGDPKGASEGASEGDIP